MRGDENVQKGVKVDISYQSLRDVDSLRLASLDSTRKGGAAEGKSETQTKTIPFTQR